MRTRRTVVDYASLPGDFQLLVPLLRAEELVHLPDDARLHLRVEDDVVPGAALHALPQLVALLPVATVEDEDLIVGVVPEGAGGEDQVVAGLGGGTEQVADLFVEARVAAHDVVEDVGVRGPGVGEAAELDAVDQVAGG